MRNYISENNAEKLATPKQLWAIFCLSKKDYRGQDLTRADASNLIQRLKMEKAAQPTKVDKKSTIEKEFINYMTEKMQGVIETAKEALQIKSVVADDPNFTDPKKCKSYAMFGFGCGTTIIDFDKRSKVGKEIKELSGKHQTTTFLKMFLSAFTKEQRDYFERVGCPLSALYYQDIRINGAYDGYVASFMEKKGVKNVRTRTYYD